MQRPWTFFGQSTRHSQADRWLWALELLTTSLSRRLEVTLRLDPEVGFGGGGPKNNPLGCLNLGFSGMGSEMDIKWWRPLTSKAQKGNLKKGSWVPHFPS